MNQLSMFDAEPPPKRPTRPQLARAARDKGIERAVDHANAVETGWADVAYAHAKLYLMHLPTGSKLTGEKIREYAEAQGHRNPPDKRAWGAVMLKLARDGLIRKIGWTTAGDPKVHCNPVSEWVRE